jgi:uncharacterized glyoxalase superfamily protein PhnB
MSNNTPQIIPMLAYENGVEAMEWLCKVFGFTEKAKMLDEHGQLMHGELAFGDGTVMLASLTADYQSPKHHRELCALSAKWYQSPYIINGVLVYVEDVETHFQKSKDLGAIILSEIETGGPGSRYRAEDLEGQRWMFMERG